MKKLMMVILSVGAAYADVKGKSKATKASVTGVLVDGTGYGTATLKKAGAGVTIK